MRLTAAVLAVTAFTLSAQTPEFEVATIRVNRSGPGGSSYPTLKNGKLVARNVSMMTLLQAAYDLTMLRIVGPGWMDTERFDLDGKAPEGVTDSQFMPMFQALVKDRFQIVSHREMREMPIFALRMIRPTRSFLHPIGGAAAP